MPLQMKLKIVPKKFQREAYPEKGQSDNKVGNTDIIQKPEKHNIKQL